MAAGGDRSVATLLRTLTLLSLLYLSIGYQTIAEEPQYCSFFNNRAPSAQPGLKNCTWFKDNSCCMQQEIAATFGRVKPLKGASLSCQKYVNYLMCYICAPNQNIFYKRERLTVCESFCDALYDSCNSAILKGSVIRNLYSSGREFCQSRRFEVATTGCFTFDVNLDTSGSREIKANNILALGLMCFSVLLFWPFGACSSDEKPHSKGCCIGGSSNVSSKKMGIRLRRRQSPQAHSDSADSSYKTGDRSRNRSATPSINLNDLAPVTIPTTTNKLCKSTWNGSLISSIQIFAVGIIKLLLNILGCDFWKKIHREKRTRRKGVIFPYVLALFFCNIPLGMGSLSEKDIQNWADKLSTELTSIATNGLCYEEIQRLYDRAEYATTYVNGTTKILEVREKLGDYFVSKTQRAETLAEKVREIHDDWWLESTQVRGQAGAWGNRWRRDTTSHHYQKQHRNIAQQHDRQQEDRQEQTEQLPQHQHSTQQGGKDQHITPSQTQPTQRKDLLPAASHLQQDQPHRVNDQLLTPQQHQHKLQTKYRHKNQTRILKPRLHHKSQLLNVPNSQQLLQHDRKDQLASNAKPMQHEKNNNENTNPDHLTPPDTKQYMTPTPQQQLPPPQQQLPAKKSRHSLSQKLRFKSNKPAYTTAGRMSGLRQERDTFLPNHGVDPVIAENEIHLAPYVHINDLGLDVYKDADIPKRLPKNLFRYDRDYRRKVMTEHSTVKIPDDVPRDSQDVYDTIKWTAKLDRIFRKNRQEDANLRWQYFGSVTGVHRVFPGHEWSSNFVGFHEDFDPRLRPWYISSTSSPKNMVIVLDCSASMSEHSSMDRMKAVTTRILSTLNKKDLVNVIVSRSEYWTATGVRYPLKPEVVSCNKRSLVPATTSNIKELLAAVQNLQPYGGSNHLEAFQMAFMLLNTSQDECQNDIIFITDGKRVDMDHRCGPGYYQYDSGNNKFFQPGDLCLYEFEEITHIVSLLQHQRHKQIGLFTFLTTEEGKQAFKPNQQTCESMGSMSTIRSSSDIYRQMEPYYRFIEFNRQAQPPVWTTPYLDQAGLGLMATVSVPVTSNLTGSHLGVVGIDVQLTHIENIIRHELWGSTYAFVIDSEDGSAIIHPLTKPSTQLLENPAFIPIAHLETHKGKPGKFGAVLKEMTMKKTGHMKIVEGALRAKRVQDTLVWRPADYSHYFYTDIPGSDYSFAFNLGPSDETYQHARDPPIDGPISFLHEMSYYKELQEDIPGAWTDLRPANTYIKYPGLSVSFTHSVVKLAPRCFCNAAAYMEEHRPSFIDIHEYINTFTPTYDVHCPRGTYRTDARPDVKLTAQLDQLWRQRDSSLLQQIAWTYVGTTGGVFRIYPGVEVRRDFDPTMRSWYHRSEVNRGKLVVSSVFLDPVPHMGKMITMSRAIHKAKPLTPPDCTGERRGYGCPCSSNYQCKSEYCYYKSCADDLIQGVIAMDLFYTDFYQRMTQLLRSSGQRKYCNLRYKCNGHTPCEVRCYIVDDRGNLVYDEAFIHLSDTQTSQYEEQSLATREGYLFSQLVKLGLYQQRVSIDHQGVCKISKAVPRDHTTDRQWLPNPTDNPDDPRVARGPIPPFQNEYNCLQQVVYYEMNKTLLLEKSMIKGNLADSPCSRGTYYFTPIKSTNLFLVVIDNYQDLNSPFNFNCHVSNRIRAPGTYSIQPNTCEETYTKFSRGPATRRQCKNNKALPFYCGYSHAFNNKPNVINLLSFIIIVWFRPF